MHVTQVSAPSVNHACQVAAKVAAIGIMALAPPVATPKPVPAAATPHVAAQHDPSPGIGDWVGGAASSSHGSRMIFTQADQPVVPSERDSGHRSGTDGVPVVLPDARILASTDVTEVPEPAALAILGAAVLALGLLRARRCAPCGRGAPGA